MNSWGLTDAGGMARILHISCYEHDGSGREPDTITLDPPLWRVLSFMVPANAA